MLDIQDRPEALKQAHRIGSALDHLHLLYEEVRNFAAPILLDLEEVDLARAVLAAWQHLESYRRGREIRLDIIGHDLSTTSVRCDRNRMDQVFTNILQNAIDACCNADSQQVTCALRRVQSPDGIEITIEDTGCGVSMETKKVFEPFVTTKPKGTGLGLAITKRIVDAHRGSIRIENATVRGARVIVELPLDPTSRPVPATV
jgi:signal transduction histidine kinase